MRMRFLSTALLLATGCGGGSTAAFDSDASAGGAAGASGAAGGAVATGGVLTGAGGSSTGGMTSGTGGIVGTGGIAGTGGTVIASGGNAGAGVGGSSAGATGAGGAIASGGTGNGGSAGASSGGAGRGGAIGAGGVIAMGGKGGTAGAGGKVGNGGKASTGGSSGAGGAGNGPPPTVEQLVPLAVGNVWNYRTTILPGTTGTSPCPAGMHATTITGMTTFQGESAFTATHFCAPSVTRYYVENAKGLEVNVGSGWSLVLPRPISDGAVFMAASSQQVIAHVADVTVPAGTFSNCWATQYLTAVGAMATYCAGVGLVTLEYDAPSGGGYLVELTSYQLK